MPEHIDTWMDTMPDGIGAMNRHMGFELIEASAERCVGRIPVRENTQPMGLLHGGASAALVETVGSIAGFIHAQAHGKWAVGVDVNATHHRSATQGFVTATATAAHLGRQFASYTVTIVDDEGRQVCSGRLTVALIEPRA